MAEIPNPYSGEPYQLNVLFDVDDTTAQAWALGVQRNPVMGLGADLDMEMVMSGAPDPGHARALLLKAAIEAGMKQLAPGAKVYVLSITPLPEPEVGPTSS